MQSSDFFALQKKGSMSKISILDPSLQLVHVTSKNKKYNDVAAAFPGVQWLGPGNIYHRVLKNSR